MCALFLRATSNMIPHASTLHRIRSCMLAAICLTTVALAVLLPIAFLLEGHLAWHGSQSRLFLVLALVAVVSARFEFPVGHDASGEPISISIFGVPLLLSALFLSPEEAMVVGLVSPILGVLEHPMRLRVILCASNGMATFVAASLAHLIAPNGPSGAEVLPLALLIGTVNEVVFDGLFLAYHELQSPGAVNDFVLHARRLVPFNVGLPVLAVTVLAPFVTSPLWTLLVLTAFQGLTFATMRIANSEQLQRRKNEYLHATFSRYVPETLVEQMIDGGQEIELGGRQSEISVLFCDIRGFTSWSEDLEPTVIVGELNALLSELSRSVLETEGTLDKYTGDGLMAFWGAPVDQPDHAARACLAATDMLVRLEQFNIERAALGYPPFQIGIGIHSGPAVVGNIGHERRLDYTAIGDTVNLAARLESATKTLGSPTAISADTAAMLPEERRAHLVTLSTVSVKGRRQPVDVLGLMDLSMPTLADEIRGDGLEYGDAA